MAEKVTIDPEEWPRYRSTFRARAERIKPEGATIGAPLKMKDAAGKEIRGKIGDYLVELEDGRLEFWTPDRFDREFELEEEAPAVQLEVVPR